MHILTGGGALLNTPVVVPMLGSDGDETLVKLTVREERTEDARSIFIAELDQPGSTGDSGLT
jgi:hypothetical protein